jgi:shikimate dehydrogenase
VSSTADGAHRCAVVGSPIDHSLSPVLHRAGYAALRLSGWLYDAIECEGAQLPALVDSLGPEWAGLSVTMPAKPAAAQLAARRSDRVELLGVANTLVRSGSEWAADNTDVDGVVGALVAHGVGAPGSVLLIGGGGTALSALAALAELRADHVVAAGRRAESRAAALELAARVGLPATGCGFTQGELADAARGADLVISTVPAGAADAFAEVLAVAPALLDVVYSPWPTPLAAAKARRGAGRTGAAGRTDAATGPIVTGLDMLLHQAFRQFELHTGRVAPMFEMRAALRAAVGQDAPELPLPGAELPDPAVDSSGRSSGS